MKPIRLNLENFGPFLNEEIDFTKIQDNQLFLISGKTGSGKTMIFDGIVYALYGKASTEKREVKHLRSQFAEPNNPLKVTFEFEVRGQHYKVIRTASYTKLGNKTETKPLIEVYIHDGTDYQLEESTISDGNQYLLDVLKLKHDQFRQLFILPQGEFKRFLMSSTTDKQQILRTLFNTQLYEYINLKLQDNTKGIKVQIEKQQEKIKDRWQNLSAFNNEELENYQSISPQQHERLLEVLPKYEEIGKQLVSKLEKETKQLQEKVQDSQLAIEQQKQRIALENHYETILKEIDILEAEKPQIQAYEAQLARITDSKLAMKLYQDAQVETEQLSEYKQQIDQQSKSIKTEQETIQNLEKDIEKLTSQKDTFQSKREFIQNTHYFYQNADQFQTHQLNKKKREQEIESLTIQYTQLKEKVDALYIETKGQVVDLEQERQLLDKIQETRSAIDTMKQAQKDAQEAVRLTNEIEENKTIIQKLQTQISEKTSAIKPITHHDQSLLNHEETVEVLRSELILDEPCPVCHQVVHHIEDGISIEALKQQLQCNKDLEREIQTAKEKMIACQTTLAMNEKMFDKVSHHQFDQEKFEELNEMLSSYSAAYETLHNNNKELEAAQKQLNKLNETMRQVEQEKSLKSEQLNHDSEMLETFKSQTSYDEIQPFVEAFKQVSEEVEDYDKSRERLDVKKQQCEKRIENLMLSRESNQTLVEKSQLKIERLNSELYEELERLDIDNVQQLEQVMQEIDKEAEIKTLITQHVETFHVKIAKRDELKQQIGSFEVKDLTELETNHKVLEKHYQEKQKISHQAELKLKDNDIRIRDIKDQITYLKEQLEEQSELVILSDIIKGANHKKLSLENYVLTYYLDQILVQANKRLANMTGGRYRLVRREKAGYGYSGLDIDVFDYYANQSRPINSLSGGETFQASLALALGLCEIVQNEQGGISLDAMFIDEGFGTLDQETLETALDTLIQLQSSGRLVGVISHVTELKERIPIILEVISNNYQSVTKLSFRE